MGFFRRLFGQHKAKEDGGMPVGPVGQAHGQHDDAPAPQRRNYEESCERLRQLGILGPDEMPPMPPRMPQYDDEEPMGLNFFRTELRDVQLAGLTLRRSFFGRSLITEASFRETDLSQSNLCWNDFVSVDFAGCSLAESDIRASNFEKSTFVRADLTASDLRRSSLGDCDFTDAKMSGAKLTRPQGKGLRLSKTQIAEIAWTDDEGEEPGGG